MNLNKNGFTLVELLGVIMILGVLVGAGVAAVSRYLDKAREQDYETMEVSAYDAAQNYMMDYGLFAAGETLVLDVNDDLVANGYLEALVDPTTSKYKVCSGKVTVTQETGIGEALDNLKYRVQIRCRKYTGDITFPKS